MSTYQRDLAASLQQATASIGIAPSHVEEAYYGGIEIGWTSPGEEGLKRDVWASLADDGPSVVIFSEPVYSPNDDEWVDVSHDADPVALADRIKRFLSEDGE